MLSVFSGRSGPYSPFLTLALLSFASLGASSALAQSESSGVSQEPLELDDISVTANMVPTARSKVGSAVTSFTEEELEERQTRLVSDALREMPGVAVNRTGPMGQLTQVRIRGSEGNQTLVLIDGIRVNDPSAGSEFDFAHLLAEEVERVEVLRGPQSALYGSDALGGVINIVTRSGSREPEGRIKAEGGSFNTALGHASFSDGGENYDYIVSGTGFRTKGTSVADKRNGHDEADGYENLTGFAKMNLRPVENFEFSFVGRFVDFASQTDDEIAGVGAVDGDGSTEGTQVYTRAQGRLSLLDDRWEQTLALSYVRHRREYLDGSDVTSHYEGKTRRIDYQSDFSFETPELLNASHVATFALQHEKRSAISQSSFSTFDRDISSTGFVGQYQTTLFERLTLTGSLRHDRNELFEDTNTYRATAAFSIFETGTKLRASYGTGVKNPTLFELYGYTNTYRGNPDLEPEKARGWDVGIDQSLWDGRVKLDATYFEQRIDNLIQGTGESSVNLFGASKIRGVELGLTADVLENLTARASYTYTHAEDAGGEDLVRRPRHLASLTLNYRFLEDRADLNLGVIYNGDQKDWAFNSDWTRRPVDMRDYVLVNLAASYRLNENAEIYGRIDNLLDEQYQQVYSYGTPGRAGYAGLRLRF